VRILLDTHVLLWAVTGDPMLGEPTARLLLDPQNQIHVSAASIWEVAIKHRKSPSLMPLSPEVLIDACEESGLQWLDVSAYHARATAQLPPLHGDPFDRMLIAQAIQEPMRLLTRDRQLAAYSELVQLV
jgi:PIN domain nuclease of toxin-antitoxin system